MATVPEPTTEEIRAKLEDIFARPEFSPNAGNIWLTKLLELLAEFFAWLGGLHEDAPLLFWLLLIGALALLAVLLAHILWTVRRVLFANARLPGEDKARAQRRQLSLTFLEEANRRAELADFTEAIRFLFLALVYWFDETGRVSFQRACTNREYLRLFEDNPELQGHLQVFVDILDDHWYGQRPTDLRQYQDCRALYEKIA